MGTQRVGTDTRVDREPSVDGCRVVFVGTASKRIEAVAERLESGGDALEVRIEGDAAAGLQALEDGAVECVVSEYDLPEQDGLEFLSSVRERYPDLPFVLLAESGSVAVASEAISAGVSEYVHGPLTEATLDRLRDRIVDLIAAYRAELELYESEDRYRTVVENSHEGVYIYRGEEVVFANDRITELTGYDASELASIEIWELLHPEDRDRVREVARRRADPEAEAPSTYEARVVRKDGEVRHCEFAVQEITYRGEYAALGSVRDITQRRERRKRLERYETMVDVSGDPMYTLDEDGHFTFVNDRLCEISGYEPAELLESHVSMLMTEADVERGEDVIAELLADEDRKEATFEMTVHTADGEQIECENHVALLPRDDGEFEGTVGVVRDIGDRKRRERRLSRLHEAANELGRADTEATVYRELVDAARDILDFDFVSVDSVAEDRLVMQENTSTESTEEYFESVPLDPSESLAARAVVEGETILVDDLRTVDVTPADPAYRSALTVPIGERGVFQAGSKSVGAFDDGDRESSEVLAEHARTALMNIEHRRELRERRRALERENERLEEFASVVSHDLRNPLTVATGRLAQAMETVESDALGDVDRALERMDRLIEDLLELARQGERVEAVEPVALSELVEQCWATVSTGEADLVLETDRTIMADRSRVAQVFENLFRNSIEHGRTGPGGGTEPDTEVGSGEDEGGNPPVTIRVGTLPDGFSVEDDGPGIPEAEREMVFDTGYSSSEEGTGFGLSIVQRVAEAHGWTVEVTEGETGGARFEFTGVEFEDAEDGL